MVALDFCWFPEECSNICPNLRLEKMFDLLSETSSRFGSLLLDSCKISLGIKSGCLADFFLKISLRSSFWISSILLICVSDINLEFSLTLWYFDGEFKFVTVPSSSFEDGRFFDDEMESISQPTLSMNPKKGVFLSNLIDEGIDPLSAGLCSKIDFLVWLLDYSRSKAALFICRFFSDASCYLKTFSCLSWEVIDNIAPLSSD